MHVDKPIVVVVGVHPMTDRRQRNIAPPKGRKKMIAEITLTAKKTYRMEYPDNGFSDEILESNFWLHEFDDDEFMEKSKLTIKRVIGDAR